METLIIMAVWLGIGAYLMYLAEKIFNHAMHMKYRCVVPEQDKVDPWHIVLCAFMGPFALICLLVSASYLDGHSFTKAIMSKSGKTYD
jgi:hypothetical protein